MKPTQERKAGKFDKRDIKTPKPSREKYRNHRLRIRLDPDDNQVLGDQS